MDANADSNLKRTMAEIKEIQRLNQSNPEPRSCRNFVDIRSKIMQADESLASCNAKIFSGSAHTCKTPFENLEPITLCDMEVPKIHHGRYLVCKVIGKPLVNFGVHTVIQDLNDDFEEAAFFNFSYKFQEANWFSEGDILIIKEPRLQVPQNRTAFLRIDSPSDVIFVDPTDEGYLDKICAMKWYESSSKDPEIWRQKANEFFKNGKYEKAVFFYDRGIRCNPDLAVLYLNKALTCLKIGAFYMAYQSSQMALEKGGDKEKALYRMGQAAYGMREWQNAAKHFCEVLKEFPQNSDASKELKRATDRLKEEKTGKFDFKSMFFESKKEKPEIDVADYTGPIEIANIPGKGRGIIASEDIQKGTLLVVSKAFSSGYVADYPLHLLESTHYLRQHPRIAAHALQEIATFQTLKNNPQRAKEIYDLYAGDDTTVEEDEEIPFGTVDVDRLVKISIFNRFGVRGKGKNADCHLFILPSYFNHDCLANGYRDIYGDIMIIHATKNINKDDEICLSYCSPWDGYSLRKEKLSTWNFTCTCKLCEMDSADNLCSKRDQMIDELNKFCGNTYRRDKIIQKAEAALKRIRETYKNRNELKIMLADVLNHLYKTYFRLDPKKAQKCLEEILDLVDDSSCYGVEGIALVYYCLSLCYVSDKLKSDEMKQKAIEMGFCVDMEHFEMLFDIKKTRR